MSYDPDTIERITTQTEVVDKQAQRFHEISLHFRGAAVALSVTLIGIAGAVIFSVRDVNTIDYIPIIIISSLFNLVILLSVTTQSLYFYATYHYATAHRHRLEKDASYLLALKIKTTPAPLDEDLIKALSEIQFKEGTHWHRADLIYRLLHCLTHLTYWAFILSFCFFMYHLLLASHIG